MCFILECCVPKELVALIVYPDASWLTQVFFLYEHIDILIFSVDRTTLLPGRDMGHRLNQIVIEYLPPCDIFYDSSARL